MEDLERAILADLHIPDPYAPDHAQDIAAASRGDQHAWEAV
jgi:hypothetical protein